MTSKEDRIDRDAFLLPFDVNGTLEGEDRERVKEYLERSEAAQDEAAFLHFVRTSVKEIDRVEGPSELERQRILQRIERLGRKGPRLPWMLCALAAALALAMIEAGVIWTMAMGPADRAVGGPSAGGEPSYRPAGGQGSAVIAVQFTDTATARQLRDLLVEHGLLIVDGPSAMGVYGLALVDPGADAATVQRILAVLRTQDIVSYASPR